MKGMAKGLLSLLAGATLPFAFAPWDISPLAILSPALLFYVWLGTKPAGAFRRGYLYGLGMFGPGVGWLHISMHEFGGMNYPASLAVTFVLVAFLALYPAAVGFFSRRLDNGSTGAWLVGVLPSLWTLGEWFRGWLFSGFPWLHLGYSQSDTPFGGFAAVAGVLGLSWLLAATAGALILILVGGNRQRICAVAVIVVLSGASWRCAVHDWTRGTGVTLETSLIQGAIPQQLKWRDELRLRSLNVYRELTEPRWGSDIIVWPETAIPAFAHQVQDYLDGLAQRAQEHGADVYIGLPVMDALTGEYFNSVVLANRPGSAYHKRHLVPFGEYLPFKSWLRDIVDFLRIPMSDFTPGRAERPVLVGTNAIAGISICYEDTFGEEVIQGLPMAEILINVSNDAWFGDSAAPHQHLQMARMRSLETGRYLLRATNTGISAVINEKGRIIARSAQFVPAVVTAEAELFEGLTPYSRFGNMPVVCAAFVVAVILSIRRRGKSKEVKS